MKKFDLDVMSSDVKIASTVNKAPSNTGSVDGSVSIPSIDIVASPIIPSISFPNSDEWGDWSGSDGFGGSGSGSGINDPDPGDQNYYDLYISDPNGVIKLFQ